MALSRHETRQLQAIEERLRAQDPDYAARWERDSAEIPEGPEPPRMETIPRTVVVLGCAAVIVVTLVLTALAMVSPSRTGEETASGTAVTLPAGAAHATHPAATDGGPA